MKNAANLNDDFQNEPLQDRMPNKQAAESTQPLSGAEGKANDEQESGLSS